jgi:hypothetical protein
VTTVRLFFDAAIAVAIMLTLSAISGFLAFAVTDNGIAIMVTMGVVFLATGATLLLRVWLLPDEVMRRDLES